MSHRSLRHRLVLPVAATSLLLSTWALADDNDPSVIEQRLTTLESKPENKTLVAGSAAQARKTLARIKQAHAAGDVPFAIELSALAKDHTDLAGDVVRAAELEQELAKVQLQLAEVEQKRRSTETLLEETIAQRERTRQALLRVRAEKAERARPPTTKAEPKAAPAKAVPAKAAPAKQPVKP